MLFKILLTLGCYALITDARCNLTDDPLELIGCLSHMSTVLLGLAKNGSIIAEYRRGMKVSFIQIYEESVIRQDSLPDAHRTI